LDSVPQLFFDNDFNLANPSTWSEIVDAQPEAGPPRLRTPESLSLNLDTLERHLLHEITLRSSAFFSALSNLQDLHSESSSCLTRIEDLQSSLREVKASQAQKGLEVIDAYEELRILRVAEQGTRKIGEAEEGLRIAKGLVEAGDWAGGLGCLADIVHWWERHALHDSGEELEEPERSISLPLSTIPALSHLPAELVSLTASIAAQLEAALSSLLLSMLGRADTGATLDEIGFRSSVEPMLVGLVQCGKTNGIEDVWREVTTTSIREGSRKVGLYCMPVTCG
jgi:vacuolar protein sorting-associated protein 54